MKASELVKQLNELIAEFGDLDVGILNQEFCSFDAAKQCYFKKQEKTGNIHSSDDVGDGEYFFAID